MDELTVAVLISAVPAAVDGATATASVKKSTVAANEAVEHETVPPAPTAGVVHDQPAGARATRTSCPPAAYRTATPRRRCSGRVGDVIV